MRTGVITIVAGREEHLTLQRRGLVASTRAPDHHVVVLMDRGGGAQCVPGQPGLDTLTTRIDATGNDLPLAQARNEGARTALHAGAQLLVFLDVDCIPSPALVRRYQDAAGRRPGALLSGPVAYLPAAPPGGHPLDLLPELAVPHPARPVPPEGGLVPEPRTELFWSLSFAVTAATWRRIGGFHPDYVGYGGEDTDFALVAAAAGARLHWVGGATAYHQHHGPSGPTAANTPSIVRNAHLFHARHGWWPMRGWLQELHAQGSVRFDPARGALELTPT